ncbi:zona pellucida sperm-binding protein 3-like [Trichomycterus rosablanca]|uniref:zona pellucida sperm-binding protein 3-like n=1 Tax=Trichomycterus rosablanca TaxID=2290929 RepID=UPI002F35816D
MNETRMMMMMMMMKMRKLVLTAALLSLLLSGCAQKDPDGREYKLAPEPVFPPVRVLCTENAMVVRVRADLYGSGMRVFADELRLGARGAAGTCSPVRAEESWSPAEEHVITANLHECGAESWLEDDTLVYSNTLFYTPPTLNLFGITRSTSAAIPVECRYQRINFVSSNQQPGSAALTFNRQHQMAGGVVKGGRKCVRARIRET